SSPGLDRPLIKDSDYVKYKGQIIDITLYKAIDGFKQYSGILQGLENEEIVISDEAGNEMRIPRELASSVRLAVIF
ncbi:MAG: ribosome maturation factor RimP, partial [Firmicutes bacterium]|nr:ribosome maturation factor RimP [Bacillota bacterium]